MPIDYSKFDNIDVSDDEDEQAYKARKEAEEAGRRASKAQAKECVEAWWQACPKQSQFTVECAARLTRAGTTSTLPTDNRIQIDAQQRQGQGIGLLDIDAGLTRDDVRAVDHIFALQQRIDSAPIFIRARLHLIGDGLRTIRLARAHFDIARPTKVQHDLARLLLPASNCALSTLEHDRHRLDIDIERQAERGLARGSSAWWQDHTAIRNGQPLDHRAVDQAPDGHAFQMP